METYFLLPDVAVLQHHEPVPGKGFLPISSFLLLGKQPVLVDMGTVRHRAEFLQALETLIDPKDLAWLVLTHPDADHMGALPELLERAPRSRVVLNWISTGKLGATFQPPLPRVTWVNAGESLSAGDRVLHFRRPPLYDCPSTVAVFDSKSRALFSSDAFGAIVPARARELGELPLDAALDGMSTFCRANSPWLADVKRERFEAELAGIANLEPSLLLSAHLPAVPAAELGAVLSRAASFPDEGRVALPGQAALDAALASLAKAA